MTKHAKQQPAGFINKIQNVAIVGASGKIGSRFASSLLATGQHTVTAITRKGSTATPLLPTSVRVASFDNEDPGSLVAVLKGQDALIIALPSGFGFKAQKPFFDAAAKAKVPWIFPIEYALLLTEEDNHRSYGKEFDLGLQNDKISCRQYIRQLGQSSWISLCTGLWFEYGLASHLDRVPSSERFGFDFENRSMTFVGDGTTKISTTTWPQMARAMTALLSLPILPEDETDKRTHLAQFKNSIVPVASFTVSQRGLFASVLRVTKTKEEDWSITYEDPQVRFRSGREMLKAGNEVGFSRMLYSRIFFPDAMADMQLRGELKKELLGLPEERLDEWVKVALEMFGKEKS